METNAINAIRTFSASTYLNGGRHRAFGPLRIVRHSKKHNSVSTSIPALCLTSSFHHFDRGGHGSR